MTAQDLISVILPFYNEEQYISRSLQSVLASDYPNLEIICIDDGSTDSSRSIVSSRQDPRIRLIVQENLGISCARNAGLEAATGDYIFFLDADDQIEPDYLSRMMETARNTDAQVVISNYQIEDGGGIFVLPSLPAGTYTSLEPIFLELFASSHFNPPWNKLYRRDVIRDRFDPALSLGEDLIFNLHTLAGCSAITVTNLDGYTYTKRENGLHTQKQNTQEFLYLYEQIQKRLQMKDRPWKWHLQKHFVRHCYEQHLLLDQELDQLESFFRENGIAFTFWDISLLRVWNKLYRMKESLKK